MNNFYLGVSNHQVSWGCNSEHRHQSAGSLLLETSWCILPLPNVSCSRLQCSCSPETDKRQRIWREKMLIEFFWNQEHVGRKRQCGGYANLHSVCFCFYPGTHIWLISMVLEILKWLCKTKDITSLTQKESLGSYFHESSGGEISKVNFLSFII